MCGFVFSTKQLNANHAAWRSATKRIECRGPDCSNEQFGEFGSAGHARLEIIGLGDVGKQPYSSRDKNEFSDLLLFNGEIYNYVALAKELGINARSDTAVLFELLKRERFDLISKLQGMFSFVFWNKKKNELISGRDKFGIKPLYYSNSESFDLCFGSVASSILDLNPGSAPDLQSITTFLAAGFFYEETSVSKNVFKHPRGKFYNWKKDSTGWNKNEISIGEFEQHIRSKIEV